MNEVNQFGEILQVNGVMSKTDNWIIIFLFDHIMEATAPVDGTKKKTL